MKLIIVVGKNHAVMAATLTQSLQPIHIRFPEKEIHYSEMLGHAQNMLNMANGVDPLVIYTHSLEYIQALFECVPPSDITVIRAEATAQVVVTIEGVRAARMLERDMEFR